MVPKKAHVQRTFDNELNSLQERVVHRRTINEFQEYLNVVPQPETEDAFHNEAFLSQFPEFDPLLHDCNDTLDSDATLASSPPPSQSASHPPSIIPHGSTSRKVRGKNKNTAIGKLAPGEKMSLQFNDEGRPCCRNSIAWARHIGQVIRDPIALPHTTRLWADLSSAQLDHIWRAISDPFTTVSNDIDTYRHVGLAQANKIWNRWRVNLKQKYITPHGGDQQAVRANPPLEFTSTDWNQLLECHYFTPEFQSKSERNARNRSHVTYVNHGGSIPYTQVEKRMERDNGRRPELGEFFLKTHSKKVRSDDGSTRLVSNDEVQSKATALHTAEATNTHLSRFEVVESVFGPQTHGRVIALGSGVTPTTFRSDQRGSFSSTGSTQQQKAETQSLHEENRKLREEVEQMRVDLCAEMSTEMRVEMHVEIQRQMADMLARFGHPPPPPT